MTNSKHRQKNVTMKTALIILAVVSVAFGAAIQPKANGTTLPEAFAEIGELMNFESFREEIAFWIENDAEVYEVYQYFSSDNFSAAWDAIAANEGTAYFVRWIEHTGVDVIGFLNRIAERFGLQEFVPAQPEERAINRSWEDFADAIYWKLAAKKDDFQALIDELQSTNDEFAEFLYQVGYMEANLQEIFQYPELMQLGIDLRGLGVDTERFIEVFADFIGWDREDGPTKMI